jgi:outer membrane receptor for ferrienterochelin and colicins
MTIFLFLNFTVMKFSIISLIIILSVSHSIYGQNISGHVMTNDDKGVMINLPGANIVWVNSNIGTVSAADGSFSLARNAENSQYIIVSYIGYVSDTIDVLGQTSVHIMLKPIAELKTIEVEGSSSSRVVNSINPINTETLNKKELLKAACCNLSESFETNNTVDAEFSDAITGAKTIRLLGLDGVYAQIMVENMPNVRGLASSYGLTFIPGPWIESIQITKGPGSVVNGYEGITGAINTEIKKPYDIDDEILLINLFGSNSGRMEANINYKHMFNPKWSTALYSHTSQMHNKLDHNLDGFIDAPLNETYAFMNKWNYFSDKKHEAQFGLKYVSSNLTGGQITFDDNIAADINNGYGVKVDIERFEAFMKNGFVFERPNTSIGTIVNFTQHKQESMFGLNNYTGDETFATANFIFQSYIKNSNHTIKAGANYLYNSFDETFDSINYVREESVPGVFGEYQYKSGDKLSLLLGLRADLHNLYGTFVTPRVHLKYNAFKATTIRASVGKGYRIANVFAENTTLLTSNRSLEITEALLPEEGWNYGITIIQPFKLNYREGSFTFDAYRTDFINQIVIDVDASADSILIYNLKGDSYSNVIQAEINYELLKRLEIRTAYKLIDAKATYDDKLLAVPLTYKHRGLVNLAYTWKRAGLVFDATAQFYGEGRLPDLSDNHAAHDFGATSDAYTLFLGQITKQFKNLEIYFGSENIGDYTQHQPIIGYDDPFGSDFDASVIYAPLMERKFYGGLRLVFN